MEDEQLETLAAHCIKARAIASRGSDTFLCYLLDMVLLETGRQLALMDDPDDEAPSADTPDRTAELRHGRDQSPFML